MKYSERLVEKIVRLIEEDLYTINEICAALKINSKTFYEWKKTKPEFRKAIEEAEDRRDDEFAALARHSLRDQLEGYIETTERIVYEDDGWGVEKIKSRVVTKRKRAPKQQILKLVLERHDRKKEKQKAETPDHKPIVLKFPKEVAREDGIEMVTNFKKWVNKGAEEKKKLEDDDDDMYDTVEV